MRALHQDHVKSFYAAYASEDESLPVIQNSKATMFHCYKSRFLSTLETSQMLHFRKFGYSLGTEYIATSVYTHSKIL